MADVTIERIKGKQSVITIGSGHSGITLTVNKRRRSLYVGGWFDRFVSIDGAELPLQAILELFDTERKEK